MVDRHPKDKRRIHAKRLPASEKRAQELGLQIRTARIELAKELARIDGAAAFVFHGCASIGEYGVQIGLGPREAQTLCNAGVAMLSDLSTDWGVGHGPRTTTEQAVRDGLLTLVGASHLGRVVRTPGAIRDADDWLKGALTEKPAKLRRAVKQRLEEVKQQVPGVVRLDLHVTERTRDRFGRVCDIESNKAGKSLSESQVFTRVIDGHLARHDVQEKKPAMRRMGPTSQGSSRTVPAEVQRALFARAEGQCEVPGCEHRRFLQFCHLTPFAKRAGQELEDGFLGCSRHHSMFDAGMIRFTGWDASRRPCFATRDGRPLDGRSPPVPNERPDPPDAIHERMAPYRGVPAPVSGYPASQRPVARRLE